jgi:hypothetical protein
LASRSSCWCIRRNDQVNTVVRKLVREVCELLDVAVRFAVFGDDVLTFDIAELAEGLLEGIDCDAHVGGRQRAGHQETDPHNF